MKIIDWYILKRYLVTFSVMILMFAPIGVIIDVSEKINRMIEHNVEFKDIAIYYGNFIIYFINVLFPIFLFLSIIWFTSKLANNTEVISILSSGISFNRFLKPYFIGATIVSIFSLVMGLYLHPKAADGYWNFRYNYLRQNIEVRQTSDIFKQISPDETLYLSNYNVISNTGFDFAYEKFKNNKVEYKLYADRIKYNEKTKNYTLYGYKKRTVGINGDIIEKQEEITRNFNFDPDDLTPTIYVAETMNIVDLVKFINKEKERGSTSLDLYLIVLHKRFSTPISAFILTIIAVAVSSMKRRGGMGVNLAYGIGIAFSFVFFDKVFTVLAEKSTVAPWFAAWFPNVLFGIFAFFLLKNAKK